MGKVLVLVGVLAASVALVGTALANNSWGSYHWSRTSNPFELKLGDNVSGDAWDTALDLASSDWSDSAMLNTTVVLGGTSGAICSPTAGRIEVCSAAYGNTNWLGLAQIWLSGRSHISQAITKVNDTYFDQPQYNTAAWRQLVMCQEIAHDFGLDHQDVNFNNTNLGSCMDYTSNPAGPASNVSPNQHDYDQLASIYLHLDGSSGGGTGCKGKKCQNGLDKAPPFSQASRAKGNVYLDDLGNGRHRITHVFWTPFGE